MNKQTVAVHPAVEITRSLRADAIERIVSIDDPASQFHVWRQVVGQRD